MALLDGLTVWKKLIATPFRSLNKSTKGGLDEVANMAISFIGQWSPGAAKALSDQWSSDMGQDKAKALAKMYSMVGKYVGQQSEAQRKVDEIMSSMQQVANSSSRATKVGKTLNAKYDKLKAARQQLREATIKANTAQNASMDVAANPMLTGGEIERRGKSVADVINNYEKLNSGGNV